MPGCVGPNSIATVTLAVIALAVASPQPATAEFSLQGKNVNVNVSGGVGGGVDLYARTFLPFLSRHLPGNPTMVVQNMPGAGASKACRHFII